MFFNQTNNNCGKVVNAVSPPKDTSEIARAVLGFLRSVPDELLESICQRLKYQIHHLSIVRNAVVTENAYRDNDREFIKAGFDPEAAKYLECFGFKLPEVGK